MTVARPIPSATFEDSPTGRFLLAFFAACEREAVRYVVLRNYESWPENFGKDVDLIVHPNDLARTHALIVRLARGLELVAIPRRKRSSHVTYRLVPVQPSESERLSLLDLRGDLVHQGFTILPAALVLEGRRRLDTFYTPSPALESLAMLLHCVLDVRAIRPSYAARLRELGAGDGDELLRAASEVVGPRLARDLAAALRERDPERALAWRRRLLVALAWRTPDAPARWLRARSLAAFDKVRGWIAPRGHIVVLVGPDGAGKTTHAELVCKRFAGSGVPVSSVYLGAQKPLLPTRRLSQQIRKRLSPPTKVKPIKDVNRRQRLRGLVHIMADKWLRYVVYVRPRLARGEVVVLDRYFYDLRTFAHPLVRSRLVEGIVMRLIPEPAITFSLRADPAMIAARKHELTTAETARQMECYRGLRRWVARYEEIPADGDLSAVVGGIAAEVLQIYAHSEIPEEEVRP